MSENNSEPKETKELNTKMDDTLLELQLGDVIKITNPLNENLNNQTFFIDYIDKSKTYQSDLSEAQLKKIGKPNYNSISVDAASSGNPGKMEYQGVDTKSKNILFKRGPYKEATNNIGEFLGLVHGLALLKKLKSNLLV